MTVPFWLSHPGEASRKSKPAGRESWIVTPVASLGPALCAVSVYWTSSSVPGLGSETALVRDRSACGLTVTAAALVLSEGSRSGRAGNPPAAAVATLAVLVITVPAKPGRIRPTKDAVTVWLSATGPRLQVTVPAAWVQALEETNWIPGGSGSVITAPVVPRPVGPPLVSPPGLLLVTA